MNESACAHSLLDWSRLVLEPLDMSPAAHHRTLISRLTDVSDGKCDRLMVLMPPGSAKSTYTSMLFPVWWFSVHQRSSVIAASHTAGLATYLSRRARRYAVEHGKEIGVALNPAKRAADQWETIDGGEYIAAGIRGPITGRRADLVVIDDPVKSVAEADSPGIRDQIWDWYRADLLTRLKPDGRIVLVMTRWHEDDLAGRLLNSGDNWNVLKMPALSPDGAALWPEWENAEKIARKRDQLGERMFSALYQQEPTPIGGALFHVERIATLDRAPQSVRAVRTWDLAATAAVSGRDPDWTVGLKLLRDAGGRITVADVVRFRGGPHEVEEAVVATAAADGTGVAIGLPQDPGQAGKQQVAWLAARLAGFRVTASPETGAKLTRAAPVASQCDAGNLAVVAAPWTRAFLDELRDFPNGRKDDQVDALSRAFSMLAEVPVAARRINLSIMGR